MQADYRNYALKSVILDKMRRDNRLILLFDGVCNLCNGVVKFILKRDKRAAFRFAPLQSETGRAYLGVFGLDPDALTSVILIEGDRCSQRSDAALRIALALGWPYKALYAFILVPGFLRDLAYDAVARHRYRLAGKRETCMIPTPDIRSRFLP